MKHNDVSELPTLASTRYERLFNIYQESNGLYFYNILNTVNFDSSNLSRDIYSLYTVSSSDTYPYIAYKQYNTIDLWWLVCAFNNIQDPTKNPMPGTQLKILNRDLINNIIAKIN